MKFGRTWLGMLCAVNGVTIDTGLTAHNAMCTAVGMVALFFCLVSLDHVS